MGGTRGNRGGRPPSAIRARCRDAFDKRIATAMRIADDPKATRSDRLKAIDLLGKYGLATQVEVSGTLTLEQHLAQLHERRREAARG